MGPPIADVLNANIRKAKKSSRRELVSFIIRYSLFIQINADRET